MSWDFYDIHERDRAADLAGCHPPSIPSRQNQPTTVTCLSPTFLVVLRSYEEREDIVTYKVVLIEVLHLFGEGIKESLTRTMGQYLEATGGRQSNANKTEWEKEVTSRMICTNNPAESPFATVRAYLNIYPSMKLRTLAANCNAVCNGTCFPCPHPNPNPNPYPNPNPNPNLATLAQQLGTHRPQLGSKAAGIAMTASPALKDIITKLCCVKKHSLGTDRIQTLSQPFSCSFRSPFPSSLNNRRSHYFARTIP